MSLVMVFGSESSENVCDADGNCYTRETADGLLLAAGVGVVLVSAIVSTVLVFQRDEAHVTVEPLRLPTIGSMRESPTAALGADTRLQGAALSVRF